MQLGIFAKTFVRPTLEATLDAVRDHGLECVQFNMACAGLPPLPDQISVVLADRIREELVMRGLTMAAVSGTFNMIHPDAQQRRDGLRRLDVLAAACKLLGTRVITLCTGTRDPENMWRRHPENDSPETWRDLTASLREALSRVVERGVTLAIEPEVANVIDSARKARRLLDEMQSPILKVVIDPANLFHRGELPQMHPILDEAFALLGPDIVLAHAKDLSHDGEAGQEAAGTGLLDYPYYLGLLRSIGFDGPLILHGLSETQVEGSLAFLRDSLQRVALAN
jgi:sugar phosphate isomerase/epimerase